MAYQQIPGRGPVIPEIPRFAGVPTYSAGLIIDATGEMVGMIGHFWNKDRASKDIRKVGFRSGAVTSAGGSVIRLSLQNVDLANGPPGRPDETQDQFIDIALNTISANTWVQSGNLSADRTTAYGELLAVLWEYDAGGRLGADSLVVACPLQLEGTHRANSVLKTGGTWATILVMPNVLFEASDGTFGTLDGAFPCSVLSNNTYNSGTAGTDEYALEFQLPFPCKVDGGWAMFAQADVANMDVILYDGTTAMTNGTVTFDGDTSLIASSGRATWFTFGAEITLLANTTYRLAFKPTTTNNVILYYFDVNASGHFQAHSGGTSWVITGRLDAGSWAAATATRRPFAGLRISSLDDGVGGAGTGTAATAGGVLIGGGLVL